MWVGVGGRPERAGRGLKDWDGWGPERAVEVVVDLRTYCLSLGQLS